jgi:hypothetical protein
MILSKCFPVVVGALAAMAPVAVSQNIYVNDFGVAGWYSDDTRSDAGVDLVGLNYTHAAVQDGRGSETDDSAIRTFLDFTSDFAGGPSTWQGLGALRIYSGTQNEAKSSISMINTDVGFASAGELLKGDFYATYRAYNAPSPTSRSVAFRLGIQSTAWDLSQAGYDATRTGEATWDLIGLSMTFPQRREPGASTSSPGIPILGRADRPKRKHWLNGPLMRRSERFSLVTGQLSRTSSSGLDHRQGIITPTSIFCKATFFTMGARSSLLTPL